MEFDRDKFKRLVHYVIHKAGQRPKFGAVKLYKVLWFSEARAYSVRQKPIAGATYIREKFGPIPKDMRSICEELVREGSITVTEPSVDSWQKVFRSRVSPNTSDFPPEELKEVDYWINLIDKEHTAESISDKSHDYAWEIAKTGEVIPFVAFFAERTREPNSEELAWARSQLPQRGLFD